MNNLLYKKVIKFTIVCGIMAFPSFTAFSQSFEQNLVKIGALYDSKKYQGFAFGTGLDRFAMFKYNIPDIRTIYGNDIRFIEEFNRRDV